MRLCSLINDRMSHLLPPAYPAFIHTGASEIRDVGIPAIIPSHTG